MRWARWIALVLLLAAGGHGSAQSLYKYRGTDGEWIYSDRPPDDGAEPLDAEGDPEPVR